MLVVRLTLMCVAWLQDCFIDLTFIFERFIKPTDFLSYRLYRVKTTAYINSLQLLSDNKIRRIKKKKILDFHTQRRIVHIWRR